jgi:hypothetical protein
LVFFDLASSARAASPTASVMSPVMHDGLVRVLGADPKLMELAFGRIIFDTHGSRWTF